MEYYVCYMIAPYIKLMDRVIKHIGQHLYGAVGTAYLLREVIDYLSATYNATTVTWYDVFSRMPVTRMGEVFYDSDTDLIRTIANGFRGGIKIQDIEAGYNTSSRIIEEDSKTVVFERDRANVTKIKI